MATERLILEFRSKGLRTLNRDMGALKKRASGANKTLALLRSTLVVVAGVRVIGRFLEMADALTNIRNRLRLATKSTAELNAVQAALFSISQRTQSVFEGNAELFQRLTIATDGLGFSYAELLKATESIANSLRISGATAQEAAGSTRQLAQALGAGAAQGEELRAVVEGNVRIAGAIARQFVLLADGTVSLIDDVKKSADGSTVSFKRLGAGGLIALNKLNPGIIKTKDIMKALLLENQRLAEEALKIDRTIAGAFTRFNNELTLFVGGLSKSVALGEKLDTVLQLIAKNFALIGTAILAIVGIAVFNLLIGQLLTLGSTATSVFGFLFGGIIKVIGVLRKATVTATAFAIGLNFGILPILGLIALVIASFFALRFVIQKIQEKFPEFGKQITKVLGGYLGFVSAVFQSLSKLPAAFKDIAIQAINGFVSIFNLGIRAVIALVNKLPGVDINPFQVDKIENDVKGSAAEIVDIFSKSIKDGFKDGPGSTAAAQLFDGLGDKAEAVIEKIKGFFKDGLIPKDFANALRDAALLARKAGTGEEVARLDAAAIAALKRFKDLEASVDPLKSGLLKLAKAQKTVTKVIRDGNISEERGAQLIQLLTLKTLGLKNAQFELAQNLKLVDAAVKAQTINTEQATIARLKFTAAANADAASALGAIAPQIQAQQALLNIKIDILENEKALTAAGISTAEAQTRLLRASLGLAPTFKQVNEQVQVLIDNQKNLGLSDAELTFETRKLTIAHLDQQRTVGAGAERFFQKLVQNSSDAATQIEDLLGTAFQGIEDAFVEFANTGKLSFKSLIDDIEQQLLRLAIRGALADITSSLGLGGGAAGAGGGGAGPQDIFAGAFNAGANFLSNLARGGSFDVNAQNAVGSTSGVDNRIIAFNANDREKVTVGPKNGSDSSPITISVVVNAQGSTASANDIGRSTAQAVAQASQELQRQNVRNN